jgi:Na+/H+ antiporter NhaD/arsenite permease-like protein
VNTLLIIIFIVGYAFIALEHLIKLNKAATALLLGGISWVVYSIMTPEPHLVNEQLTHHLGELSGILFFLLGAMTIVELIDAHDGFDLISSRINQTKKVSLLWTISLITFFLSSVLDNLTTTIVMVSLLRKLVKDDKDRLFFAGMVVIAANAGGAWSPIGDVTTTMLWINGQISTTNIILKLFLPSMACIIAPLIVLSFFMKGKVEKPDQKIESHDLKPLSTRQKLVILISGIMVLVLVPVFKTLTHLPPYLGILIGLGILWIITEIIHGTKDEEDKNNLSVVYALRKADTPSILFFFGILMCIAALQSTGILNDAAKWMSSTLGNENSIAISLGLISSVVDNVPLVAASQGMYSLEQYPMDHSFWTFLAFCTGTGGSALIIGSAAGVAAMGIEKISFIWYLKRISLLALLGYFAGVGVYLLQNLIAG